MSKQNLKKNIIYSFILQFFIKFKGVISLPIMTYFLIPDEIGKWKIIINLAALITPLISLNILDGGAIFFSKSKNKEEVERLFSTSINFISIIFLFFIIISSLFIDKSYRLQIILLILMIFNNLIDQISSFLYIVFLESYKLLKFKILKEYGSLLVITLFLLINNSYTIVIIGTVLITTIISILQFIETFKKYNYLFTLDIILLKKLLCNSIVLLPMFTMTFIMNSLDSFFIKFYDGDTMVGIYSIAYSIASMVLFLSQALNLFWFPLVSKYITYQKKYFCDLYIKYVPKIYYFIYLVLFIITIFSKELVHIFASSQYESAYTVLGLITFSFMMQIMLQIFTAPLYSEGKNNYIIISYIFGSFVNIVLNIFLIKKYSILGAAFSTLISYMLVQILLIYYVQKELKIDLISVEFIGINVSGILVYIFLQSYDIHNIVIKIVISVGITFMYLLFLYVNLDEDEKRKVHNFIKRKNNLYRIN